MTTTAPGHGPEIEYLTPGVNGVATTFDVRVYAHEIARLLDDPPRLASMKASARASAERVPMSQMVDRFADGIVRCLGANGG